MGSPTRKSIPYCLSEESYTWIGVDRQGLVFFRVRTGPNVSQRILYRCRFLDTVPLACKTVFRCRFLAIVDIRTIHRDHAKHATQVVFE